MTGNELLSKRRHDKNQRLLMIHGIYHVKYSVESNLSSGIKAIKENNKALGTRGWNMQHVRILHVILLLKTRSDVSEKY